MSVIPIALQLYSIRHDAEKDLRGVLMQVAEMGYQGVEFAGLYGHDAAAVRKMLDEAGLVTAGAHTPLGDLLGDGFTQTVEVNQALGNRYVIIPWLPEEWRNSRVALEKTVKLLNELAERLSPYGMQVGYHNHAFEFLPVSGLEAGELPWDVILRNTRPEVVMQLDVGHVLRAGSDPLAVLERFPGRARTVHLKDFSPTNEAALLGEGDVPWPDVFRLCATVGGTDWYIVEQETYPVPPLESVRRCLERLKAMLAAAA